MPTRRWNVYCTDPCKQKAGNAWTAERKAKQHANRERINENQRRRLRQMHPFARRVPYFNHRYQARITVSDLEMLMIEQEHQCAICGVQLAELVDEWDIDHIRPVALGGSSEVSNLQLVCRMCNRGKWTMTTEQYVAHCQQVAAFSKARKAGAKIPRKKA